MNNSRVLIISQDLILANHLISILEKTGYNEYHIVKNIIEAQELIRFGGFELVFYKNFKLNKVLKDAMVLFSSKVKLVFIGGEQESLQTILDAKEKIYYLNLPFTQIEVKRVFEEAMERA